MKKLNYKKLTRDFLNGRTLDESKDEIPLDNDIETQELTSNVKEEINMSLEKINQKNTAISKEAMELLNRISSSSQSWGNVFDAVEDLRKDFRSIGSLDSTADQRQIGMSSVLLILFELVIQTNLRIQPVDVHIIINTLSDNFTNQEQIDALKKFMEILNIK